MYLRRQSRCESERNGQAISKADDDITNHWTMPAVTLAMVRQKWFLQLAYVMRSLPSTLSPPMLLEMALDALDG